MPSHPLSPSHPTRRAAAGRLAAAAASALLPVLPAGLRTAAAQPAPQPADPRAIRLVVGYAPGGAADTVARAYAQQLQDQGGPPVLVDNRAGASGRLGLEVVKSARPDGLTLYLGSSPLFTVFPLTYRRLGFDPDRDLRPVAVLADVPTAAAAGAGQPFATLAEYLQWVRQRPGGIQLGLATLGSPGQLGTIALARERGLDVVPVVYRGASPMLVDVAGGEPAIGWDAVASMMPLYNSGRIKLLGVSGTRRLPLLPKVPTLLEQGFEHYRHATSWYGIFVPAATPDATVDALEKALLAAGRQPALAERLQAGGLLVDPQPRAEALRRIQAERAHWRPIVQAAGIVVDE